MLELLSQRLVRYLPLKRHAVNQEEVIY
uniref:Bromodomain-containing protein 4 n=1 Tax=Rhizophora mucronata TaxID=61149 RepID=A0A2P2J7S8_RHIMU